MGWRDLLPSAPHWKERKYGKDISGYLPELPVNPPATQLQMLRKDRSSATCDLPSPQLQDKLHFLREFPRQNGETIH